jgi:non-specific serine/threonine protein kinase
VSYTKAWVAAATASSVLLAGAPSAAHVEAGSSAVLRGDSTFWKPAPAASVSRYEVAGAQVGHFAYVLGGIPKGKDQPVGTLERYDLDTGHTALMRPLPVGVDHTGLVTYQGDLIAVGGNPTEGAITGPTSAIADVYRYDTKANTWSKLTALPDGPRGGEAVGVVGDRLLVAGGARPRPGETSSDTVGTLEIFDLKSNRWSKGPDMPTPRTHVGGAVVKGFFYTVGGSTIAGFGGENLPTVERYDPQGNRWQKMPNMPRLHWAFGITRVAGRIAVIGGVGSGGLIPGLGGLAPQVDLFDPGRRTWSTLPGMRTPRHHFGAVAVGDRVYAIEGTTTLTTPTTTTAVERLDIPHPSLSQTLVDFKATIRGARVGESGKQSTLAGEMRSRVLGSGAIVNTATTGTDTTNGTWSILTPDGELFAKVLEISHAGSAGVTLDGIGTITGGTARYKGASGWFDVEEKLSSDFKTAAVAVDGTVIRRR